MDLKPRRRAPNFVEEDEGAIRGKHQYYPFSSSSSSATTAASPVPYSGGFTVGSNHHRPQMVTWLGDLKLKTGDDNPIQSGDGSMKNDRFMDLSMNLKCHQEADEEEGDGGDMINREVVVEKEHMFDKVVTPSDVGKLNRLVIPKQHAERFFPLEPLTSEKGGLLLSFEDRTGKPWRFRYSYWNSSQSYVMTKGWSRFVKEKKLDAGDIVSFLRGIVDKDRLFIDWRHRPNARLEVPMSISYPGALSFPHSFSFHQPAPTGMWNINDPGNFRRDHHHMGLTAIKEVGLNPSRTNIYGNIINSALRDGSAIYPRSSAASPAGSGSRTYGDGIEPPSVFDSVPVGQGEKGVMAPSKRQLRLFGVNMDCSMSESYESDSLDHSSSQYTQYPTSSVYNGMSLQPNNEWLDKDRGPTSS